MKRFQQLIAKDIFDCLTEDEQKELEKICKDLAISEEAYEQMKRTICSAQLHREIRRPQPKQRSLKRFIRVAALFILPLSLAAYLLLRQSSTPSVSLPEVASTVIREKPERKAVQLILANGETVKLSRAEQKVVVAPNILNTGNMLQYQPDTVVATEVLPAFNTIIVPAAGEFNIRLADGTQVWLNENTQLKYPVEFTQDSREIHLLEGEIYLEVAKDAQHPFIVHTDNSDIEVLGTHFNVRRIASGHVETTLAEGKVKVSRGDTEVILHPGQQARAMEEITVTEVDVEEVICWKDNLFYFKDAPLETILNKLAGWYDFEISWQHPELKTKKFFMSLDRYASVQEILDKLAEAGGIYFSINGKTVNVSK